MRLHILGCGDAFGSGGRNQSGYLVEASNRLFLLDCGPTTLLAMKRAGFDPQQLDVIFSKPFTWRPFWRDSIFLHRISLSKSSPAAIAYRRPDRNKRKGL